MTYRRAILAAHAAPAQSKCCWSQSASLISRRTVAAISAESPTHRDRGVEPVRPGGVQVSRAKGAAVTSQIVNLVLGDPQLKISRQLKCRTYCAVVGNWLHGGLVTELGDVPPEAEFRLEEEKKMPCECATQRLDLDISANKVAGVRRALRCG